MALPKYLYSITPEGAMRIVRSDGTPIGEAEADWIKVQMSGAVRGAALRGTGTHERYAELEEIAKARASGDVDPLILELEDERLVHHLSRAQVASLAGSKTTRISDYTRGVVEPKLNTFKPWAAILGWKIVLIPFDLAPKVTRLVDAWKRERQQKIDHLRMEKE